MSKKSTLIVGDIWIREAIDALDMILHCVDNRERIVLSKQQSYFNLQQQWIRRHPNIQKEFPLLAKEIKDRTINYRNFLVQLLDLEKKAYLEEDNFNETIKL